MILGRYGFNSIRPFGSVEVVGFVVEVVEEWLRLLSELEEVW